MRETSQGVYPRPFAGVKTIGRTGAIIRQFHIISEHNQPLSGELLPLLVSLLFLPASSPSLAQVEERWGGAEQFSPCAVITKFAVYVRNCARGYAR